MLNPHFKKAASAVKAINTKGTGMFAALLAFVQEHKHAGVDSLREHFKTQEKLATAELKVEMTKNSTYKVAKGKLIKAVELGIPLVDKDGKPVGKTALENAIKEVEAAASAVSSATKAEPTPFDKFALAIAAASDAAKSIDPKDMVIAAGLVNKLYKDVSDLIPVPAAA